MSWDQLFLDSGDCEKSKMEQPSGQEMQRAGVQAATRPPATRYCLCTVPDILKNSAFKFLLVAGFAKTAVSLHDQAPYNYGAALFVGHRTDGSGLPTLV
jgi:hypothetical protein